ncbi:TrbC/VirB2 family protein [Allorhizobium sp. BGMRC 0089]|uniref:TrbC/VirB2 family protein n=1 Tax=Allorhizobium sonneratiae TaxID=2934936 RepID=UPI002034475D|nr:TrbC/VirB2 family protein [Allorhizobium sonneratiae]MCM2294705.1 TrbC/VirB2 family protein [Allorhizobium sonneratiae]
MFLKLKKLARSKHVQFLGACSILFLSQSSLALAADTSGFSPIVNSLNTVITFLSGSFAQLAGTLAIITVGVSWLVGRLNLAHALQIAIGIAILIGAPTIFNTIAPALSGQ